MKKIFPAIITFAIMVSAIISSCRKNEALKEVNSPNAAAFFDTRGPQAQVFNFNTSDLPKSFSLNDGTVITIPAGAFAIGGTAVNGPVILEATAFSKKGDMMLGGLNTMSNGQILESQGSFKLATRVNGLSVDDNLPVGKFIKFEVPAAPANPVATQLFNGIIPDSGAAKNQFNWIANNPAQPNVVSPSNGKYTFNWGKLGWINCDVFNSFAGTKTTIKVNLANNPGTLANFRGNGGGNTFVFFVPKTINSTVQVYTHTNNTQVVSYTNTMPIGMEGVLLAYCIKDGEAWFVKKYLTISANMEETLTLLPSSTDAIQAELNSLNGL
jgi:hypothetical protein